MKLDKLKNKRVLVVGLGVTGESVVRYLYKHAVSFDVVDEKTQPSDDLLRLMPQATVHKQLNADICNSYEVIVLSPGIPRALPAIQAAIENGAQVIGDIELFADAIGDTPVIAVTGSNGKSTVVSWVAHVLHSCGKQARLCGNIGLPALDSIDDNAQLYVLELSSYQLESTHSLKALSATVLNVSDDHMDRYDSIEHYAQVKRHVYQGCEYAVINRDDKRTWTSLPTECVRTFSLQDKPLQNKPVQTQSVQTRIDADYHLQQAANDGWLCRGEQKLMQCSQLPLPGDHNVANALAVLALLEPINLDLAVMLQGLGEFKGLEHRTEYVAQINDVRWYNDSKGTNIDACKKAVQAMNAPVVLIAGGMGKGADFNELRDVVEQRVKALVLIGEDAEKIKSALLGAAPIVMASDLNDAVNQCDALAERGDVVLLSPACSSFDMFANFAERGRQFKQAVEAIAA